MPRPFEALLFDLDGTLIDSMPLHHEAWRRWFARHALPFDEHGFFEATAGRTNEEILRDLLPARSDAERAALADEKEALYREEAARSLALIAGAAEVLHAAKAAGLRLAICTAAPLDNIRVAAERFGLDRLVETIVSPADRASGPSPGVDRPQGRSTSGLSPADGLRGKPHPDIFEEAARRLGVEAARCLVFEDAPLGIEAARRAGMDAIALTTTLPAAAFSGYPNLRHTMPDFIGFDPTTLTTEENKHA